MADRGKGVTAADVEDPFPEDRAFDERLIPHGHANGGKLKGHVDDGLDRDERYGALSHHLDVVIRDTEQAVLKVDQVAAHVDREDLPSTRAGELVTKGKTIEEQARVLRPIAIPNDILISL